MGWHFSRYYCVSKHGGSVDDTQDGPRNHQSDTRQPGVTTNLPLDQRRRAARLALLVVPVVLLERRLRRRA
jgi:hypothetical protein